MKSPQNQGFPLNLVWVQVPPLAPAPPPPSAFSRANLFGREADLADSVQCPNRTFAFGTGGLWIPAAPSGLSVSTTPTDYVLSWTDKLTNEAGFRIEYSTDGTTWTSSGTVGPG